MNSYQSPCRVSIDELKHDQDLSDAVVLDVENAEDPKQIVISDACDEANAMTTDELVKVVAIDERDQESGLLRVFHNHHWFTESLAIMAHRRYAFQQMFAAMHEFDQDAVKQAEQNIRHEYVNRYIDCKLRDEGYIR